LTRMGLTEDQGFHYIVDQAGVWAGCIRQRRPVIHNDCADLSHREGLPEGNTPVIRMLAVPVFRDERIVAVLGVGNKETDYSRNDVKVVSEFAEMTWDIILRKRAEIELRKSENSLRKAQRIARLGSWELDLKADILT
jgi:GAF domain-containing protein